MAPRLDRGAVFVSSFRTGAIQELPAATLIAESQQLFLKWL
jgi:hypothetical protein